MTEEVWLTRKEAAAKLRVSLSTFDRMNPPGIVVGRGKRPMKRYQMSSIYRALNGDNVVELRGRTAA